MSNAEQTNSRRALIGGISGGIGSLLAKRLQAGGWRLAGFARDADKLKKVRDDLEGDVETYRADGLDSEAVDEVFDAAAEKLGGLDAYVHCIGSILIKPIHTLKDEEWHNTVNLNLHSAFYALRAAVKKMQKSGGSIVLISTVAARTGVPSHEAIAGAKAGLHGLALSAASTYASRNIRVNVVAPGLTDTPMAAPIVGNEQARKLSEEMHPLGRIAKPDEVAALIAHLVGPDSDFITGQIFGLDGGLSRVEKRQKA
jgi:NAD(P)-dependent dehydrogenase (short-subunit alcohol dehydrogenase family)